MKALRDSSTALILRSSVSTQAIALRPDLQVIASGPGSLIDAHFSNAGQRVENLLNRFAYQCGSGPLAAKDHIVKILGHHDERQAKLGDLYCLINGIKNEEVNVDSPFRLRRKDLVKVKKVCHRLLEYANP